MERAWPLTKRTGGSGWAWSDRLVAGVDFAEVEADFARRRRFRLRARCSSCCGRRSSRSPTRGPRDARPPGVGRRCRGTRRARARATLFTGHMSGVDWIPRGPWAAPSAMPGSTSSPVGAWCPTASATGTRTPASRRRRFDWRARPPRRSPGTLRYGPGTWATRTPTAGRRWKTVAAMAGGDDRRRSTDRTTAAVTIGIHIGGPGGRSAPRPRGSGGGVQDFLTMHGYPIYAAWSDGPTDDLVPFLGRVRTRWLGSRADVLFSEFGLPTAPRGEPAQPPFVAEDDAARATRNGCSTDCDWPDAPGLCSGARRLRTRSGTSHPSMRPSTSARSGCGERTAPPSRQRRGRRVRGRHVFGASRRRLDRHRRRPVLAAAGRRAPAPVRPLRGAQAGTA